MTKKSEIPFGAQFSPNQVNLVDILQILHDNAGDRVTITSAIQTAFFTTQAVDQQWQLADNALLAIRAYGLLEDDGATLTTTATDLFALAENPTVLHERFAYHILTNLRGITLIETILAMQNAGEEITLDKLQKRLEQRGLHVPRAAVHLSSMRLWLAKAGIFAERGARLYHIDQTRFNHILGIGLDSINSLTQLDGSQRAFLRALIRIPEADPLVANKVADLATMLYSVQYNHKELPQTVLHPLLNLGYVTIDKSTEGRGAKPYQVSRTEKFRLEISEPILNAAAERAGLVPREMFELPLSTILTDLKSSETYVKGKALELLAIYWTRLIDLEFKGWRTRSADTGGAEVDAIVEGARLIFSRWQIQAKNTKIVRLDDVAKEVGLSLTLIQSNVVMVITTGDFTSDAYRYAEHVMKTTNLNIILLNGDELRRISADPTDIVGILNGKAERAMQLKIRNDYFTAQ